MKDLLWRVSWHVEREIIGYVSVVLALVVIAGFALTAKTIEAGNQRRERLCNHFIHLLVVMPDGRVLFPGKPGVWTNIDLYVEKEVPGVMQVVESRNYIGALGTNNYQRLTIVERRCGG